MIFFKINSIISEHMYDQLYQRALLASKTSYSPYSHFSVGAAVLLEDGTIVCASNQENSSFSLTMCAERVALFYAQSEHPTLRVVAVAIASPSTTSQVMPCGACRQVMSEIQLRQASDFDVVTQGLTIKASELMPQEFKLK